MDRKIIPIRPEVSQKTLWGGEVDRKRRPSSASISGNYSKDKKHEIEADEPARVIPDYASSPVVTWMYVAQTLQHVLLTGRELGMPDPDTTAVFLEDGPDAKPKPVTRLTRELFRTIMDQLDQTTARNLGEERARVIGERWERIVEWAAAEGWMS